MRIYEHHSLKNDNTFHVDATARYYIEVTSLEDIRQVLRDTKYRTLPILPLGEGSNILFTRDFEGVILKIKLKGIHILNENSEKTVIEVASGENWHEFVTWTVNKNLEGVENMALIPGTVGAAPIQNIGAYGQTFDETVLSVKAIKKSTGELIELSKKDCEFGYRTSIFKNGLRNKLIIVSVVVALNKQESVKTDYVSRRESLKEELNKIAAPPYRIQDVYQAVVNIRTDKLPDPRTVGTAGSFFKNPIITLTQLKELQKKVPDVQTYPMEEDTYRHLPKPKLAREQYVKVAAGWLLEEAQWRGRRIGNVATAQNQALCVVAFNGATGEEIKNFVQLIQTDFEKKYGIKLEPEVNII